MSKNNFENTSESIKQSVLVTGANGFVGANLCRKLIDNGYNIIAGVRKSANLDLLEDLDIEYRYGDITLPDSLIKMVKDVNYVIHNAGIVKAKKKQSFFDINEQGTRNVFEAILKVNPNIKKIIYISSLAAAGNSSDNQPVTENDNPHPITTYGHSKLAGEKIALSYKNKLNVCVIRPSGVYGPGDKEIMTLFQTVNNHLKPFIGDCSRKLQLVHVDDLCRGISKAMTTNTNSGSIYFICEKKAYSLKELMNILETASGKKAIPVYIPSSLFKLIAAFSETAFKIVGATPMLTREKAGELLASWEVSTAKAKKELDFESAIDFNIGAKETYRWYREKGWL